jgi:hypothetical protein
MEQGRNKEPYPAEKARQGEIILRSRARRIVFIIGLVAAVVVILLFSFLGGSRKASGEEVVLDNAQPADWDL